MEVLTFKLELLVCMKDIEEQDNNTYSLLHVPI